MSDEPRDGDTPAAAPETRAAEREGEVRRAGAGVALITGAKLYFILAGFAVQFLLPRLLASAEEYGTYATVLNVVSILNNVLIAGTIQTVSKLVSEREHAAAAILRRALLFQLVVALCLSGLLAASSTWVARDILLDARLGPMLAIVSVVVFAYALYAALIGALNGRRLFARQAGFDVGFSTMRTAGILVPAALGIGALGSVAGFSAAAMAILLAALVIVGVGRSGEGAPTLRSYAKLALPLIVYQSLVNVMLQIDLSVLRRYATLAALDAGESTTAAAELGARLAGFYRAAQSFAFIPYQLIIPVTFVVFPLVSKAVASDDRESAKTYVRDAMRFSLLVLIGLAAPLVGGPEGAMRFAFPAEYGAAASALRILTCAQVFFALFVIAATILSGSGRVLASALIALAGVLVLLPASALLIARAGAGDGGVPAMEGAALGTGLGTLTAFVAVTVTLQRKLGASFSVLSVVRTLVAGAASIATTALLLRPTSKVMSLAAMVAGGVVYLVVLLVTRELTRADLDRFVRRRRKPASPRSG